MGEGRRPPQHHTYSSLMQKPMEGHGMKAREDYLDSCQESPIGGTQPWAAPGMVRRHQPRFGVGGAGKEGATVVRQLAERPVESPEVKARTSRASGGWAAGHFAPTPLLLWG
jgi:hypothetical protein